MDEPTDGIIRPGLRAGSRFGHYRLRRVLGSGGFGQVWEAEDTVMDRVVALKLLRSEYSENEKFRQRLFREARAAGRLSEPHVVPIHNCAEIGGQLYIDMRLIDGTELGTVLAQEGPLHPARAVAVVRQIAAALDAAHAAQMIHRDVKPANILLAEDDFACLLDFGLANAATDAKLTSTGFTIGTVAYMSPERLNNGEVDHRTDIYALACVLYECLTGSPPYTMPDRFALIAAHGTAPIPRPSQHGSGIPAGFDDVISCGMAKNAADRYASAGKLARAALRALVAPVQGGADITLARTQAATGPAAGSPKAGPPKAGPPKAKPAKAGPPKASPPKATTPKANPPPETATPTPQPWWQRQRRQVKVALVVVILAAAGITGYLLWPTPPQTPTAQPGPPSGHPYSPPTQTPTPTPVLDPETAAAQQLQQLRDEDRSYATAQLADRWVPQLSSKHGQEPWTYDREDGVTYNNQLILQEHQRLRQQYGAKLLWTGDWTVWDHPDYWVTVVPKTFSDASGALSWCTSAGLDSDHCSAQVVSATLGRGVHR